MNFAPDRLTPGDYNRSIQVGDLERSYLVHIPKKYNGRTPVPVVLAFHGGGTNAASMVRFSGLNDKSDSAGFVVVYPNGTGRLEQLLTWNAGNCCGYAQRQNVDDVAFVDALLNDLQTVVNVDPLRFFSTGISNGGMISYRLADELSGRIAAIAPVGGPIGKATCNPKRPVPVLHFHGTEDRFAPYKGGRGERSLSQTNFYSVQHTISAWVKANSCATVPELTTLPARHDDGTKIIRKIYQPAKPDSGAEVVLYEIEGGGHTWPGREPPLEYLGKSTTEISANDLMWEFFEKHPLK